MASHNAAGGGLALPAAAVPLPPPPAAAAGAAAAGAAGSGDCLIDGLSERKKSLLEARIFGKAPSSLDGLSAGTRSASSSPAAFHRLQSQQQQPLPAGHVGQLQPSPPVAPLAFAAQRSAGTEPTVLEMTDSNSRSQQQQPPPPPAAAAAMAAQPLQPVPVSSSASREGLPPSGRQASAPSASSTSLRLPQQQQQQQQQQQDRATQVSSATDPSGSPAANRKLFGGTTTTNNSGTSAKHKADPPAVPPVPQLPVGQRSLQRTRSDTSSGVVGGHPGASPQEQQAPSSAAGGRKRPRSSNSGLTIDPSPPPAQLPKVVPSPSPTAADPSCLRPSSVSPARLGGDGSGGPAGCSGSHSNQGAGGGVGAAGSSSSNNTNSSKPFRTIDSYFTQRGGGGAGGGSGEESAGLRARVGELERQLQEVSGELERARRDKQEQEQVAGGLREELVRVREEGQRMKEAAGERERKAAAALEEALRRLCQYQERETREQLARNSHRLGRIVTSRSGPHGVTEVWEEGTALRELQRQGAELLQRREELDKRKRQIARESKKAQASLADASAGSTGSTGGSSSSSLPSPGSAAAAGVVGGMGVLDGAGDGSAPYDELQILMAEESVRMHLGQLKKDEAAVQEARKALEREKSVYVRELRRVQHEDRSRFARRPVLHGRYLLLSLLGRGGFSEVWKAFDLRDFCETAVKIHQLNQAWTEEKKQNYMKHATREYAIHREMSHPRVVRLFDVFEIDSASFATVLEYCKGTDLDYMIKTQKMIPERDARAITMQILAGLRYLNTPSGSRQGIIIHYDLKPGNVLFDENGDVKITDFGLSKIVDDSCGDGHSMELTSQGAGTYWYLPPECFVMGSSPPRISSKVDVWALGVIFYQMLFGCRPFGEGQSQEKVLHENTMLRATHVSFPPKPPVSADAKEFIRACLTHSQADRPDVLRLCQHPYLRLKKL